MFKALPILVALTSLALSQDIAPLVAQIPTCIEPCLATVINNACGDPNDWACGCTSDQVSDLNIACEDALYDCTIPETQDTIYLIGQICGLEAQPSAANTGGLPSATLPVSSAIDGAGPTARSPTSNGGATPQTNVMVTAPTPTSTEGSSPQKITTSNSSAGLSLRSIMGAAWLAVGAGWVRAILVSF